MANIESEGCVPSSARWNDMNRRQCSVLALTLMCESLVPTTAGAAGMAYTEISTELPFDAVLPRLIGAIEAAGMRIFATIDHAAAAAEVGLSMPLTTVLIYGNPKGGTPVMLASPIAALDLPLRVLVRANSGHTIIAFHPISEALRRVGVPEAMASRLSPAQKVLVEAIERS
jgi:uncharacterized protein (DUF302 family)